MDGFGAKEKAEGSSNKPQKRGRGRKLTEDERHERKIERDRQYRRNKKSKYQDLEKENYELKREVEVKQSKIKSSNKKLSESTALADKTGREVSDESKKVNEVKMVNEVIDSGMQQLQDFFLTEDDQEAHVEQLDYGKLIDDDKVKQGLLMFYQFPNPSWSVNQGIMGGFPLGEGTSTGNLSSDTLNVKGYAVKMENSSETQEIFSLYPDIVSGLQARQQEFGDAVINRVAELYKMAKTGKHSLEEMQKDIKILELAGIDFLGLMHRSELQGKGSRQERKRKTLEAPRTSRSF